MDVSKPNLFGYSLIEFCKNNDIYIVNGRIDKDCKIGKTTCKDRSVVDYIICFSFLFSKLCHFEVHDFNQLFSDAHSVISLSFQKSSGLTMTDSNLCENASKDYIKWNSSMKNEYTEHFASHSLDQVISLLDSADLPDDIVINSVTEHINDLFTNSAKHVFGYKHNSHVTRKKSNSRPWFGKECYAAREKFHRAKTLYHRNKTTANKEHFKEKCKLYKQTLSRHFQKYKFTVGIKLRSLRKQNSRTFWTILNRLNQSIDNESDDIGVSVGDMYNHFKDLNTCNFSDEVIVTENILNNTESNGILNDGITENEVLCAVKLLKNNKAPGADHIINEYIVATIDIVLPVYVKLFNIILDSGKVPDVWLTGIIKPIYKNKGSKTQPENYRGITLLSCLSKLFTSILNSRLNKYADQNELINKTQSGFRKGYSTLDNIFILFFLVIYILIMVKKTVLRFYRSQMCI